MRESVEKRLDILWAGAGQVVVVGAAAQAGEVHAQRGAVAAHQQQVQAHFVGELLQLLMQLDAPCRDLGGVLARDSGHALLLGKQRRVAHPVELEEVSLRGGDAHGIR